ncbi:6-phosphogluconolactonase [Reticulibacter mediterranei]|uniref:6-phosphogluconolactonase n=1 Tax=Reticulibacter mediterranei TaxID=2778369 RepID=A0A8J3N2H6_9CHLR|nr:6-phosphogluconolactonase [Reticulibacter mediterranei]GHO95557.1 6-phosphogluconolactonase [Reticulibacter mediterranei]
MHIAIYPDTNILSHEAAQHIVRVAQESIVTHGRFTLALSGGNTPKKLYGLLASEPYVSQIDWNLVEIFWSDERCVSPDSPDSNYHMAQEVFLSKVPIPANQIHRTPADEADRDAASEAYAREMRNVFGTNGVPKFDLIQLGMGPEGHTASLFPHQASLHEQQRLVMPVSVPKPPPARLTFTPPLLNAAAHILFLVTGADKEEAVQAVLEGDHQPDEYPAQIVQPSQGEVTWMLDTAAAAKLKKRQ